jgi:peptidoglycan hydrolase-like protein with peptidoglycan-binding domain
MTSTMLDAVHWQNLVPMAQMVACYRDGPISVWPAEALKALGPRIAINITCLADERWEAFDAETGNASNAAVATGAANRLQAGKWSWIYTNGSNLPDVVANMKAKGIRFTDAQFFPKPAVYLWAAAPGTKPGSIPGWCPVGPAAVQDRWMGGYDMSTVYVDVGWRPPAPVPPPKPAPPPPPAETRITVQLLQVQEGNQGAPVRALQLLLNGHGPYGLQVDGIFGPKTTAAVRNYQGGLHLQMDGIAGVHTWGNLLGVPQ